MNLNIKKHNWILLLLNEASDKGLTPVKLQKSLFLLSQTFPSTIQEFYHFIPYNYGPFDVKIYHDADSLADQNFVNKISAGQSWDKYQITPEGKTEARKILKNVPANIHSFIKKLIPWIIPLSFQEIVTTVYKHFPEYKRNSVFRENYK